MYLAAERPQCAVLTALTCESFQTRASQLSAGTGSDLGDLSQGFRNPIPLALICLREQCWPEPKRYVTWTAVSVSLALS